MSVSRRYEPIVLCYHATSEHWDNRLSVSPRALERHLRLLLSRRFRPVAARDVVSGRGRLLHVTFDDAFRSVLDSMPTIERLGVPATVFACTSLAAGGAPFRITRRIEETEPREADLQTLDWDGLRELVEHGIEIGSHTVTHPRLTQLDDDRLRFELNESRDRLESELRRACRFLAYPSGDHDERVRRAARAAGYEAAFALPGSPRAFDAYSIPRVGIWRSDGIVRVAVKTSPVRRLVASRRGWT